MFITLTLYIPDTDKVTGGTIIINSNHIEAVKTFQDRTWVVPAGYDEPTPWQVTESPAEIAAKINHHEIAVAAMQGILANEGKDRTPVSSRDKPLVLVARASMSVADEMLSSLDTGGPA